MIDSPSLPPEYPDRPQDCAAAMVSVVRTLEEEGHLAGWTREEILVALTETAEMRLGSLGDNNLDLSEPPIVRHAQTWPLD